MFIFNCVLLFAALISQISTNAAVSAHESFIQIHTNITKCPMFIPHCRIPFSLNKNVNPNDLHIDDGSTRYYIYQRMEFCDNRTTLSEDDCKLDKFNATESSVDKFRTGFFFIEPKLVAKVTLTINDTQSNEVHVHQVYIVQPNRVIDKVHQVYIIVFQSIISVVMGLLIDVKALVKIVKMPVPVLVGFFSQYLCMPLVRKLKPNCV